MEDMEEKLGAMLSNPELMQKVMAMAQSLGQSAETAPPPKDAPPTPPADTPQLDPALLQKLLSLGAQTGIDRNGQALLKALGPYLTCQRITKLERAMRAARLAKAASAAAGSGALSFLTGR